MLLYDPGILDSGGIKVEYDGGIPSIEADEGPAFAGNLFVPPPVWFPDFWLLLIPGFL